MTNEIKPCPFCGASMRVATEYMFTHPGTFGEGECLLAGLSYYWEHIDWWNTRAGEPTNIVSTAVAELQAGDRWRCHNCQTVSISQICPERCFECKYPALSPVTPVNSAAVTELQAEVERLREALTPSGATKAEYIGEFKFGFPMYDCAGEEITATPTVPWTTIKEIMAAILVRADRKEPVE